MLEKVISNYHIWNLKRKNNRDSCEHFFPLPSTTSRLVRCRGQLLYRKGGQPLSFPLSPRDMERGLHPWCKQPEPPQDECSIIEGLIKQKSLRVKQRGSNAILARLKSLPLAVPWESSKAHYQGYEKVLVLDVTLNGFKVRDIYVDLGTEVSILTRDTWVAMGEPRLNRSRKTFSIARRLRSRSEYCGM